MNELLTAVTRALSSSMTMLTRQVQMVQSLYRKPVTWASNFVKNLVRTLFKKPSEKKDYIAVGRRLISKRLMFFLVAGLIIGSYLFFKMALPWLDGRIWVSDIYINSEKYKTFSGNVRVHDIANTVIFEGSMDGGKMSGYGVQYNSSKELVYKGNFKDSKYSGDGEKYEHGRLIYQGNFTENLYDGQGRLYTLEGQLIYSGDFSKGEKSGVGVEYSYETGNQIYYGHFEAGQRSGVGREYLDDGTTLIYEGNFAEGVYKGDGKIYENNKLKYEGSFLNGIYSGKGSVSDGVYSGNCKLYDLDTGNLLYNGDFAQGKYNGYGILYNPQKNVKIYEGKFSSGKRNGAGSSFDILGSISFKGNFKNDDIDFVSYLGSDETTLTESFGKPSYKQVTSDNAYEYLTYSSLDLCLILDSEKDKTGEIVKDDKGLVTYKLSRSILGMKNAPYGIKENTTKEEIEQKFATTSFAASQFTFTDIYKNAFSKLSSPLSGVESAPSIKYIIGGYFIRLYYSSDSKKILGMEIALT